MLWYLGILGWDSLKLRWIPPSTQHCKPNQEAKRHYPLVNVHIFYAKSPFLMGKSTIFMAIFNSYFDITRGYLLSPFQQNSPLINGYKWAFWWEFFIFEWTMMFAIDVAPKPPTGWFWSETRWWHDRHDLWPICLLHTLKKTFWLRMTSTQSYVRFSRLNYYIPPGTTGIYHHWIPNVHPFSIVPNSGQLHRFYWGYEITNYSYIMA